MSKTQTQTTLVEELKERCPECGKYSLDEKIVVNAAEHYRANCKHCTHSLLKPVSKVEKSTQNLPRDVR